MFKLIVKKEFSSAHILHGHPGDCKRMHGHNWLVEAEVQGNNINEIGMVIDFKDIKNNLKTIISKLDHQFLNDLEPFINDNPTADKISCVWQPAKQFIIMRSPSPCLIPNELLLSS